MSWVTSREGWEGLRGIGRDEKYDIVENTFENMFET